MSKRKTQKHMFNDRIRFNWGYHDAASDVAHGRPRCTGLFGQQSPNYVSRQYDAAYYEGYVRGLADARHGAYEGNSEAAWLAYHALPNSQPGA